jgi:hypothetical protein
VLGLAVSSDVRERVLACEDRATLDGWLFAAATARDSEGFARTP